MVISCAKVILQEFVMLIRISFGVLIATSLALTVYFGTTAWRLSGDLQNDGAGRDLPFSLIRPS
jgi:hypothetical protein